MKIINIVFDGDFSDVDLIEVPDYIAENIEEITQDFLDWVVQPVNRVLFTKIIHTDNEAKECLSVGTAEFIWWLRKFEIDSNDTITLLAEHVSFHPEYPSADF